MNDWPTILSALLTPFIALIAVYIAFQQWKTNRSNQKTDAKRLKLEQYDKRFAIYDTARTFLKEIVVSSSISDEMLVKYWVGINPARFLLGDDLTNYLEEIEKKAVDLQTIQIEAQGPDGPSTKASERGELKKWFYKQISILNEKFLPYLKLER
jgi:hypothetical protein